MTSLSSNRTNFLRLITRRGHWRVAPRYFLNVSPVALKATPFWERRRVRNFVGRRGRRFLRKQFPWMMILGLLAVPLGTASADILYVTHLNIDGQISVVDSLTGDVVPIPLNLPNEVNPPVRVPICIAITPDGKKAYVSTLDDEFSPADIVEIDTVSKQVTSIFRASAGGHPCVAISPEDGTRAYLSTAGNSIDVIETVNNTNLFPISTSFPGEGNNVPTWDLGFNPDGSMLYALATTGTSNAVKIVGPANNPPTSTSRIQLFGTPRFLTSDLAVTSDGVVYMSTIPGSVDPPPTILVFDANNQEIPPRITAPRTEPPGSFDEAAGVAITPDDRFVYVALRRKDQVIVIDTTIDRTMEDPIIATITVGESPLRIVISPDGSAAYVTNSGSGDITVIDTASVIDPTTPIVVSTLENVGGNPFEIAILPSGDGGEETMASLGSFQCLEANRLYTPRKYKYKKFGGITHLKLRSRGLGVENFCSPVDVFPLGEEGQGLSDPPNPDLTCYEKKHWKYSKHFWRWWKHKRYNGYGKYRRRSEYEEVNISNMFGKQTLRVATKKPNAICLPSGKGEDSIIPVDLDRFKCFEAKKVWGARLENRKVTVDDGIESTDGKIVKPVAYCIPVDGEYKEIVDATEHLTCYKFRMKRSHGSKYSRYSRWRHWKHRFSSEKITVNNDFGEGQKLRVSKLETICVPTTEVPPIE